MNSTPSIFWFRQDLRLDDNPGLLAACKRGRVTPIFIWAPEEEGAWVPGFASRWWLNRSLASLDSDLRRAGSRLIIRHGPSQTALAELAAANSATKVFWNRRYEPAIVQRDAEVQKFLAAKGIVTETFNASLLFEPSEILNQQGRPYQIFTAFWNRCLRSPEPPLPLPAPASIEKPSKWPESIPLGELSLDPRNQFSANLDVNWRPGTRSATARLNLFADDILLSYPVGRDRPDIDETSRLSAHLHFGEISPTRLWHTVRDQAQKIASRNRERGFQAAEAFLRQIVWREFAHYILHHFPGSADQPSRPEFAGFPWRHAPKELEAWKQGLTGYPLVDAGMRQLQKTGWMHNRVRMIVAGFLVKHLMIPWQSGARWFWDNLVDADLANNAFGWQWSAGCGYDAAPYFRIFNPVIQGQRFDSQGNYIRRWVPELSGLEPKWIHRPWQAPTAKLAAAHLQIGKDYPAPIVEHAASRERALAALTFLRDQKRERPV